jgi:hypothetical protein
VIFQRVEPDNLPDLLDPFCQVGLLTHLEIALDAAIDVDADG